MYARLNTDSAIFSNLWWFCCIWRWIWTRHMLIQVKPLYRYNSMVPTLSDQVNFFQLSFGFTVTRTFSLVSQQIFWHGISSTGIFSPGQYFKTLLFLRNTSFLRSCSCKKFRFCLSKIASVTCRSKSKRRLVFSAKIWFFDNKVNFFALHRLSRILMPPKHDQRCFCIKWSNREFSLLYIAVKRHKESNISKWLLYK